MAINGVFVSAVANNHDIQQNLDHVDELKSANNAGVWLYKKTARSFYYS